MQDLIVYGFLFGLLILVGSRAYYWSPGNRDARDTAFRVDKLRTYTVKRTNQYNAEMMRKTFDEVGNFDITIEIWEGGKMVGYQPKTDPKIAKQRQIYK
jgi:hypothetical protein